MTVTSLQKAAREQGRLLNEFVRSYEVLEPQDPRLEECEEITFTFALRNYQKREELSYILAAMQGRRVHYLVTKGIRKVSVYAPPYLRNANKAPARSELASQVLEYQSFLRAGSFGKR